MIEWIKSLGVSLAGWFVENKDGITAFFMSGQAISFVAALIMLVKNLKGTRLNTSSTDKLNQTLTNTNDMANSIAVLDTNFQALKQENDTLRKELKDTEDALQHTNAELLDKLNAIIEVQGIVYSTIRDDSVRQTVNTILNNARYCEQNFKDKLEKQIEELRKNYVNDVKEMGEKMDAAMQQVSESLNAAEQAKAKMSARVDENIRY